MAAVDLEGVRSDLLKYGWIKDARVSRRLPETLVIDVIERSPAAVWQHNRRLSLIDDNGVVLEAVTGATMPDLPLLIGPGANRRSKELAALLEDSRSLKPLLAGATWVGNRRWDLRFESGETLSLPEGERAAKTALARFTYMEGSNRLLGRGIIRFDMRDPTKFVLRMPPEGQVDGTPDAEPAEAAAASDADTDA
jgi:cell division protein FtsQ